MIGAGFSEDNPEFESEIKRAGLENKLTKLESSTDLGMWLERMDVFLPFVTI